MNNPRDIISASGRAGSRTGFTLAEMLVAVGAVLLLSVGVGQVFKQVSKLVGTGSAVAELDQYARAIERQLRDDFAALERTPSEQTCLAIRGRRIGDINYNGTVNSAVTDGERNIYLRRDDLDTELRGGVTNPYGVGGRGISPRMDEILFLVAGGGEGYLSSERGRPAENGRPAEERLIVAQNARIYYGQGVRPSPPVIDQTGTPYDSGAPIGENNTNYPIRAVLPDPYTTQNPPPNPPWGDVYGLENSRNQFAGDFFLLRQAVLLYGGLAAGFPGEPANLRRQPLIGESRDYAPFIRDMETVDRIYTFDNVNLSRPPGGPDRMPRLAQPRLLRQGRTDICAQDIDDVRLWLEGMGPADHSNMAPDIEYADATAYRTGYWNNPDLSRATSAASQGYFAANDFNTVERPLWVRQKPGPNATPEQALAYNLKSLQSAIAGCFSRVLAESEPSQIVRNDVRAANGQLLVDPFESLMDTHATFASRCSSLEIAWSDGTTWQGPRRNGNRTVPLRIDLNNDGTDEYVYNYGDIIWFDYEYPRRMLEDDQLGGGEEYAPTAIRLRPEILSISSNYHYNADVPFDSSRPERLNILPNNDLFAAKYDERASGGSSSEYLAIWGFREPTTTGEYGPAWVKPRLIRIRMTLHDAQFRIREGRRYEFVFSINQF